MSIQILPGMVIPRQQGFAFTIRLAIPGQFEMTLTADAIFDRAAHAKHAMREIVTILSQR